MRYKNIFKKPFITILFIIILLSICYNGYQKNKYDIFNSNIIVMLYFVIKFAVKK